MKKFLILPLLAVLAMAFTSVNTKYNVSTAGSNITWTAYKVTGQHTGDIKLKSGSLDMKDGVLAGGSFEVDMNSMTCTDLQGEYAGKLIGHLKAEDFFFTEKYPTAKFVITKAIPTDSKGNYKIVGNMTIKWTTKEVKFNAFVSEKDGKVNASGKITIDRSDFEVKYGSGSFFDGLGDKTIYDDFDLQLSISAAK